MISGLSEWLLAGFSYSKNSVGVGNPLRSG